MLNSWKEQRDQDQQFSSLMEQFYNAIYIDTQSAEAAIANTQYQLRLVRSILNNPDSLATDDLTFKLFNLGVSQGISGSETKPLMSNLKASPGQIEQSELVREIISFAENETWFESISYQDWWSELLPDLPRPSSYYISNQLDRSSFFTPADLEEVERLRTSRQFTSTLKSIFSHKALIYDRMMKVKQGGEWVMNEIIERHPNIRFFVDDISILGSALKGWNGDEADFPMNRMSNTRWELQIRLSDGAVKFRNRRSWDQNWGGSGYPSGSTIYNYSNIPVTAGMYLVTLDIGEGRYSFERLGD